MQFLENYYRTVVKYDLINKFSYKMSNKIPTMKKIILNFGCKSSDLKLLSICVLALELISNQKGILTRAKCANLLLKIRKGNPVGCKVILKKQSMYCFLSKLIIEIFPRIKSFNTILHKDKSNNPTTISYRIANILIFPELEKNYYLFSNINDLQIVFSTNTETKNELIYLLNCFKLPFSLKKLICKCNSIGRV